MNKFFSLVVLFTCHFLGLLSQDVNQLDIWNPDEWKLANQNGIESGEIKFCFQDFHPFTIRKNAPKVIKCNGNDVLWLSYQIHIQKVYKNKLSGLNDQFGVITTHGNECDHPSTTVDQAETQMDCYNFEEFNAVKGEKCVRKNIAVDTFGSNHSCFIVYCLNHQLCLQFSNCDKFRCQDQY